MCEVSHSAYEQDPRVRLLAAAKSAASAFVCRVAVLKPQVVL